MVRTQLAKYARSFEAAAARTVAGPCSILRTAACACVATPNQPLRDSARVDRPVL